MANCSRWDDIKKQRPGPTDEKQPAIEQHFALGELIYELHTSAGLSQREPAERMGTTQSVISRLEEGRGGRPRLDTLARVATTLERHLVVSLPDELPKHLKDAIQVAWIEQGRELPAHSTFRRVTTQPEESRSDLLPS